MLHVCACSQKQLLRIAANTKATEKRRLAAVAALRCQRALTQLAGTCDVFVRSAVVRKLKNRKILKKMALLDPERSVRKAAMCALNAQAKGREVR